MNISKQLKSNRGSSLTMVILIITTLTLLGYAIVAVTMSNLKLSLMYSDVNKAYFTSEAGVEQVAKVLDEKVAIIQQNARQQASDALKSSLALGSDYLNTDGTLKDNLVGTGFEEVKTKFSSLYLQCYKSGLEEEFSRVNLYNLDLLEVLLGSGSAIDSSTGKVYRNLENSVGRFELISAQYNSTNCYISIEIKGTYKGYKKTLEVTFNLLPENSPYNTVLKVDVKRNPLYNSKAVIAEGNVIAAEGITSINGDVESFGTVPQANGQEDSNALWCDYGGIMAGMSPEIWDNSFKFGFDPAKIGRRSNGTINITGNASTFAYIHSLYGTSAGYSNLNITGNTFARSVKSEPLASFSTLSLQDVYTSDNFQIDSNNSDVAINGAYYGFIDGGYMTQGMSSDPTSYDSKRTSSIVVNGDSTLTLNGDIYIGGSSFFKNYTDDSDKTKPYMTGLAAAKSGNRLINAFLQGVKGLYWYTAGGGYTNVQPAFKSYSGSNLISGRADYQDTNYFPITNRGMQFKKLWETNEEFANFVNTTNIRINKVSSDGKLYGYSNGAIAANGKIYGVDDFVEQHDPVVFSSKQEQCKKLYHDSMQDFLSASYSEDGGKLDYIEPTKSIESYININFIGDTKIPADKPYTVPGKGFIYYASGDLNICHEDRGSGLKWYIGGYEMPLAGSGYNGVIWAEGNIYLDSGDASEFNFTGMLIASKNIVFLGKGDKKIKSDIFTVLDLMNSDINIAGLFRSNIYEMSYTQDEKLVSQKISQKNITIVSWQEK
jgi:hypothetical protein